MKNYNIFKLVEQNLHKLIEEKIGAGLDLSKVTVEPPRDKAHGDMATNAAMVLTKQVGKPPRELAEILKNGLETLPAIASADVAGPGFINLRLAPTFWQEQLKNILEAGLDYGRSNVGQNRKVSIEYVSANPTGPVHVGHTRGAVFGDVLCNLFEFMGYDVLREYIINDLGAQTDKLARSVYQRYLEALGHTIGEIPEGLYPGDYLVPVGQKLAATYKDKFVGTDESEWFALFQSFAIDEMMALVKKDLADLGVHHNLFSSDRANADKGLIQKAIDRLQALGLLYHGVLEAPKGKAPDDWEPREQLLFRSTQFGDDTDRALKKSDGSNTYFANDIAYHYDKLLRSDYFNINVFGKDHGGYTRRVEAAMKALTEDKAQVEFCVTEIIRFVKDGKEFKMSKRRGTFVTLRDVLDEVGKDVLRFILLTRKHDQLFDFDFDKVKEQSKDNPVFYVQYAHARCCSIFRHAREMFADLSQAAEDLAGADLSILKDQAELDMIRLLTEYPRQLEAALHTREPHRLAFYVLDIAAAFHSLWNRGSSDATLRFLDPVNKELTRARLALVKGVQILVASNLRIFGVTPAEEMK